MEEYKFSYCGEVFRVTREDEDYVYGQNSTNDIRMKKSELKKKYFEGQIDFGKQRIPDLIE